VLQFACYELVCLGLLDRLMPFVGIPFLCRLKHDSQIKAADREHHEKDLKWIEKDLKTGVLRMPEAVYLFGVAVRSRLEVSHCPLVELRF